MRILFAGGGTGGHIFPLVAVGEDLMRRGGHEILWLGRAGSLEEKISKENKIPFRSIPAGRIVRKWTWENVATPIKIIQSISAASVILHAFHPDVLLSSAGYVSFGPLLAGKWANIPIVLMEQNAIPGIVSRLLSHISEKVVLHFPESEKYFSEEKRVTLGNPIRTRSKPVPRDESARYLGLRPDQKTILFAGGSLGAQFINTIVTQMTEHLLNKDIQIVLWAGENGLRDIPTGDISDKICVRSFETEAGKTLGCIDLVVSRAGGTWTAEILAAGIPSLLIPYPFASENHQWANAKALEDAGCVRLLEQQKLQPEVLMDIIFDILGDKDQWNEMRKNCLKRARPDAARRVADILLSR